MPTPSQHGTLRRTTPPRFQQRQRLGVGFFSGTVRVVSASALPMGRASTGLDWLDQKTKGPKGVYSDE